MEIRKGIAVSPGIAIAKPMLIDSKDYRIPRRSILTSQRTNEVDRLRKAFAKAIKELEQIERKELPQISAAADDPMQMAARLQEVIEVDGQLELAKAIATAALYRKESRGGYFGGHYRSDYPSQDDKNWLKNITLKRKPDGTIDLHTKPLPTED